MWSLWFWWQNVMWIICSRRGREKASRHLNEKNEQRQKCFVVNMKFTQNEITIIFCPEIAGALRENDFIFIVHFTKTFLSVGNLSGF